MSKIHLYLASVSLFCAGALFDSCSKTTSGCASGDASQSCSSTGNGPDGPKNQVTTVTAAPPAQEIISVINPVNPVSVTIPFSINTGGFAKNLILDTSKTIPSDWNKSAPIISPACSSFSSNGKCSITLSYYPT